MCDKIIEMSGSVAYNRFSNERYFQEGGTVQKETNIILDKIQMAQSEMDKKCNELFLNKEILAPVLRDTVEEYAGLTIDEIIGLIDEASISRIEAVSDYPQSINIQPILTTQ